MKVGLVTIYQVPNYGSVLQAFATQEVIENLGHQCFIVRYRYPNKLQKGKRMSLRSIIYTITTFLGITAQQRKIKKLNKFKNEYFHFTRRYNSYKSLEKANWDDFNLFAVGSDQVWHTKYTKGEPAFLLSFLPNTIRRIAVASSFASDKMEQSYKELFKSELQKFTSITVREENGLKILSDLLPGKSASVCLDPTLLLSKEEWKKFSLPSSKSIPSSPYILLYMWTYAFEPRPYIYDVVRYFKEQMGCCKVIALEGYCNIPDEIRNELGISCAEDSSVPEFINLFLNAGLVITSSFHGSAFAINFQRPLVSIVPNNSDDRQSSFLKSVSASNCIVPVGKEPGSINPYYDESLVEEKLNSLRDYSVGLIKSMMEQ